MKKKNSLKKALLITLSVFALASCFNRSTLHAMAADIDGYASESLDPDTNPGVFIP